MVKEKKHPQDLSRLVKDLALNVGAIDVGIVTTETLEGGPPSTDLSYVLDDVKSGVVIQLEDGSLKAVSPEEAREYLAKMSPAPMRKFFPQGCSRG